MPKPSKALDRGQKDTLILREYSVSEVKTLIEAEVESSLESMLREGARRMLQTALELEVSSYIEAAQADRDEAGHQAVVRQWLSSRADLGHRRGAVGDSATAGAGSAC
mgnify:CR=1 FL=1